MHKGDYTKAMAILTAIPKEEWQKANAPFDGKVLEIIYYKPYEYHDEIGLELRVMHLIGGDEPDVAISPTSMTDYFVLLEKLDRQEIKDADKIRLVTDEQFESLKALAWELFKISKG